LQEPHFEREARGATIRGVTRRAVEDLLIPLPPIEEQRRIADILDKAEALRAKRRQAIARLDTLAQSIFIEMFGDPSQEWPRMTIKDVSRSTRTGPFGSQLLHSEFVDEGIAVLGIDNAVQNKFVWARPRFITHRKYSQLKRYQVFPGDVLITIMGTCGRCAVVPEGIPTAINTKHLCCITPERTRILPEFLQATLMHNKDVLRQLGVRERGAVMPGLNMELIRELTFSLPPISLQERFTHQIRRLECEKELAQRATTQFDALFTSLQHRAFRGEL
jgi:type I restriction enzyme S subunit